MPAKRYDYDAANVLHAKGLAIREISEQTHIPYDALQKYAQRQRWTEKRTKAVQSVCASVQERLAAQAEGHLLKISTFADRAIDHIAAKPLEQCKLGDLATLASVADTFDRIARRAYGLDQQQAQGARPGVMVQVNTMQAAPAAASGEAAKPAKLVEISLPDGQLGGEAI